MRLTILSRASTLARLQARLVADALARRHPDLEWTLAVRSSAGDRDTASPLASLTEKGAFTADLSQALIDGHADLVVHSWKDLPLDPPAGTRIAATLERADPRDLVLVRRETAESRPRSLTVLTCSPRRAWFARKVLPDVLPWSVESIATADVRGNIPTRLRKLLDGRADALIVAKAAIDRLLMGKPDLSAVASAEAEGLPPQGTEEGAADAVRACLARCRWMVMPMREWPWAPAQGALAIEIASAREDLAALLETISHRPTWDAVNAERAVLAQHGGGCHQALGAAVIERDYGRIVSIQARGDDGGGVSEWRLDGPSPAFPRADAALVWPRPDEDPAPRRTAVAAKQPDPSAGLWVARADALPEPWTIGADTAVWAAGMRTWRRLAGRGVWVNGCADSLGDREAPDVDRLHGRPLRWVRLTHTGAADEGALATYAVDAVLPDDLPQRTHFFWTSGQQFREALSRWPSLRTRFHASGPGRTWTALGEALGPGGHAGVWLDRESWLKDVIA